MDNTEKRYNARGVAQFYGIMGNRERWEVYYLLEEAKWAPEKIAEALEGEKENNMIKLHHKHIPVLEKSGLLEDTTPEILPTASHTYQSRVEYYMKELLNNNIGHTATLDEFRSEEAAEISKVLSDPFRIEFLTELEKGSHKKFDYNNILEIIDSKYPAKDTNHHQSVMTELHHKHFPLLRDYGVLEHGGKSIAEYNPSPYIRDAIRFELDTMG